MSSHGDGQNGQGSPSKARHPSHAAKRSQTAHGFQQGSSWDGPVEPCGMPGTDPTARRQGGEYEKARHRRQESWLSPLLAPFHDSITVVVVERSANCLRPRSRERVVACQAWRLEEQDDDRRTREVGARCVVAVGCLDVDPSSCSARLSIQVHAVWYAG